MPKKFYYQKGIFKQFPWSVITAAKAKLPNNPRIKLFAFENLWISCWCRPKMTIFDSTMMLSDSKMMIYDWKMMTFFTKNDHFWLTNGYFSKIERIPDIIDSKIGDNFIFMFLCSCYCLINKILHLGHDFSENFLFLNSKIHRIWIRDDENPYMNRYIRLRAWAFPT